jgi:hypothetical protein
VLLILLIYLLGSCTAWGNRCQHRHNRQHGIAGAAFQSPLASSTHPLCIDRNSSSTCSSDSSAAVHNHLQLPILLAFCALCILNVHTGLMCCSICCRAAPGVQTLSTVPVSSASSSSYNAMPSVGLVTAPSSMDDSVLKTPSPRLLGQSKTARITGQLVDCGLGKATCEGVCANATDA